MTPTTLSRFSRENVKLGKPANNDVQTRNTPRRNGIIRTNSDNHKAINDDADSLVASFLGNETTRDAATQIIESLKYSDYVLKEINEIAASFRNGKQ
jgi:DNA-binding transcriptional regulator YhcF (GntR family)